MLCSKDDAVTFAKITGVLTAAQLAVLDDMLLAATPVIEDSPGFGVGPVELGTRTFTDVRVRGSRAVRLPWRFTRVLSVTVDGQLVDPARFDAVSGADIGMLLPASAGAVPPWGAGSVVVVECEVGSPTIPPHVRLAALELVAYWWQSTQQSARWAWQEGVVPQGFAVPARVKELLGSSPALPGFS